MSKIYKHILYVNDLEEDSNDIIIKKVKELVVTGEKSKLTVLNIVLDDIITGGYEIMPVYNNIEKESSLSEHQEKLNKIIKDYNLQVDDTEVISALSTSAGIIDYAKENNVNLIVVGLRERKGFFEYLLGSTAKSILSDAPCDILSVFIPHTD